MYDFEVNPMKNKNVETCTVFGTKVTDLPAAPCTVYITYSFTGKKYSHTVTYCRFTYQLLIFLVAWPSKFRDIPIGAYNYN